MAETHFVPFETIASGRKRVALCGRFVLPTETSAQPTCPDCRKDRAEADAADAELERRAVAQGISVEELLFGAPGDDVAQDAQWPAVPR